MSRKSLEITIQKSLLQHLKKGYSALVWTIKTTLTNETINSSDIILCIICHAKINNENKEDLMGSSSKVVLTTKTLQLTRQTSAT